MEKDIKILYEIHTKHPRSQRAISSQTGLSLGFVNGSVKRLEQQGLLIKSEYGYELSAQGIVCLEKNIRSVQAQRLLAGEGGRVNLAVILAAGANPVFSEPVGMLPVQGVPLTEYLAGYVRDLGVNKICLVTGYGQEAFREHFQGRVIFRENPSYARTGTMASLAAAADVIDEDFLLLESNQFMDCAGVKAVAESSCPNAVLLVNPSGSMDEAYVELDEKGDIYRISKDICQMNRIDAELVGVSKISFPLFQKMMEYYERNENPFLNYEYVLESLGRIYQIQGVLVDDLAWTVVESRQLYKKAQDLVYASVQKKEKLRLENHARETFARCMEIPQGQIEECQVCGGMTNRNFRVKALKKEYILRIPGAGTDRMIDRAAEEKHNRLGEKLGINVPAEYFSPASGVKISVCIPHAQTLTFRTARWDVNMRKTADILSLLHHSGESMARVFDVRREYEEYKKQAQEARAVLYPDFAQMDEWFYELMERMEVLGWELCPCHNDLVPENFIRDRQGRIYLIDWEYAGLNDPMWDIGSHFLECEFTPEDEQVYLEYYYGKGAKEAFLARQMEKIRIFQMSQDILWSLWTAIKEAKGEDFGSYGRDRLARAAKKRKEYIEIYGETKARQ